MAGLLQCPPAEIVAFAARPGRGGRAPSDGGGGGTPAERASDAQHFAAVLREGPAACLQRAERRPPGDLVVAWSEALYPDQLRDLGDPPLCLFVRGGADAATVRARLSAVADTPLVAVVGTRTPSSYGEDMARLLGGGLARAGLVVVSGLALGIDAVAQSRRRRGRGPSEPRHGGGARLRRRRRLSAQQRTPVRTSRRQWARSSASSRGVCRRGPGGSRRATASWPPWAGVWCSWRARGGAAPGSPQGTRRTSAGTCSACRERRAASSARRRTGCWTTAPACARASPTCSGSSGSQTPDPATGSGDSAAAAPLPALILDHGSASVRDVLEALQEASLTIDELAARCGLPGRQGRRGGERPRGRGAGPARGRREVPPAQGLTREHQRRRPLGRGRGAPRGRRRGSPQAGTDAPGVET